MIMIMMKRSLSIVVVLVIIIVVGHYHRRRREHHYRFQFLNQESDNKPVNFICAFSGHPIQPELSVHLFIWSSSSNQEVL